ncbi:hypothetical protein [Desulfonatronum thiosulfatophilum]
MDYFCSSRSCWGQSKKRFVTAQLQADFSKRRKAALRKNNFLPLYLFFVHHQYEVTVMLPMDCLREIEEMLTSGQLAKDFEDGCENDRYIILDFLEKLMELGEAADKTATEVIFKGSYLEMLAGTKDQK